MGEFKHLNVKIKIKNLDEFENKLYLLNYEFEMMKRNMKSINRLIEEINQTELVVDVDRDSKNKWKTTRLFLLFWEFWLLPWLVLLDI